MAESDDGGARVAAQLEQDAGNAAVSRGDWAAAHERYTASLALHATAAVYSNRAATRVALGRALEAVGDAREALRLDPGFVKAYVRLSAAQRALGDDASALSAARKGLELAERTNSPVAAQLREAVALVADAEPPRLERRTPEARANFRNVCAHCDASPADARVCSGCRSVCFCDDACQQAGWAAHKRTCKRMAANLARVSTGVGLDAPKGRGHLHALQNWATAAENEHHMLALEVFAWHVQQTPPRAWNVAAGAVMFKVMRDSTDDSTLRLQMLPLAIMKREEGFREIKAMTAGLLDTLGRVDINVGFLMGVEDRRSASVVSSARLRYSLPTDLLQHLATEASRLGKLRIVDGFSAEVDVELFRAIQQKVAVMLQAVVRRVTHMNRVWLLNQSARSGGCPSHRLTTLTSAAPPGGCCRSPRHARPAAAAPRTSPTPVAAQ